MYYQTASPYFPGKDWIMNQIERKLDGEGLLTMGHHVRSLENEFANYVGREYGIATNSCTSALEATLSALEIHGAEVIVPAQTFIATGSAVVSAGGTPVFAEINPGDFSISLDSVRSLIGPKTAAVIIVHFGGLVSNQISQLQELCERNDIYLIEDAAHAHGATRDGRPAGSFGHVGCFSFYATKNMTTAEGGMVVLDDNDLAERISSIRNRGIDLDADKERYVNVGSNYRMSELAAILGRSQLEHLEEFVTHRNQVAQAYDDEFSELADSKVISRVNVKGTATHAYWRYTIKLQDGLDRKGVRKKASSEGIAIDWAYDPPLHLQPVFRHLYNTHEGMLPATEQVLKRHICLPIHCDITEEDAVFIAETVRSELYEQYGSL